MICMGLPNPPSGLPALKDKGHLMEGSVGEGREGDDGATRSWPMDTYF